MHYCSGTGSTKAKGCGSGSGYTTLLNREREQKGKDYSPHRKIVCFLSRFFKYTAHVHDDPQDKNVFRILMCAEISVRFRF
jgi:hypothetical protein